MNENDFIAELQKRKQIVIYGAGMVGKLVYSRLLFHGLKKYILGFVVSSKSESTYLDLPLYQIAELIDYKDTIDIVIATLPNLHMEILNTLYQYGFCNIWKVTENLYQDMSAAYIEEFRKFHVFKKQSVDILLMSSDNNASSGAFLCLADLSVELSKRGISNVIVLPNYGNGEDILIKKKIDYVYIPSKSWSKKAKESECEIKNIISEENIKAIAQIEQFIEIHQVKLIHNNTSYTYVGAIAAKNKHIPFIWHIRENIFEQGFSFIDYKKSIELINQSEKIIAVSRFITTSYQGLNLDKICVCYDGVNVSDYYNTDKSLFCDETVVIIQVGVITPAKNQKELIEAAYALKKMHVNFLIQFIGNGEAEYIEELREMIKKYSLENQVIFLGRKDNIHVFYKKADIVVVCSRAEPFGRTTIEAQLSKALFIGANAGATPELVENGKTGFLYDKGNSEDLAKKIKYAITNPIVSRKITEHAQNHACNLYSKERNAEEIINVYTEILSNKWGINYGKAML